MEQTERAAIVLELMGALRSRGSWCGETHVQKCVYLIQEGLKVPSKFEFVLYKYGPYSFELHDLLGEMRADLLLDRETRPDPYGPTLKPSASGANLLRRLESTTGPYRAAIALVAEEFGGRGVSDLERIGTAMYVTREGGSDAGERASRVVALKPHVGYEAALTAVQEVDRLLDRGRMRVHGPAPGAGRGG